MHEKQFGEIESMDTTIQNAVIESLGGNLPDNYVESAAGGAVSGPPDPAAEADEQKLIDGLDALLGLKPIQRDLETNLE